MDEFGLTNEDWLALAEVVSTRPIDLFNALTSSADEADT